MKKEVPKSFKQIGISIYLFSIIFKIQLYVFERFLYCACVDKNANSKETAEGNSTKLGELTVTTTYNFLTSKILSCAHAQRNF